MAETTAGELRHGDAERRDERRQREGDLVADSPVECLSTVVFDSDEKSMVEPEAIMASVRSRISRLSMPLRKIAIVRAAICSSPT
ncbi:hypothetical protein GCM10025867_38320 [Frondihabitans sucicola]|uniref:Uncharacterized protein n=1 Tax=Frondihabitans sucicola TaxID=1268041 RepID=A0ABN6Y3D5_9MICO|nr:hypothetical protein GCM10025867_38320 [Frondihabitans sucicola]